MSYFVLPGLLFTILALVNKLPRLGERERESEMFFCYRLLVIWLFLFEGVPSSSGCLGKAASFNCGTPFAFHYLSTRLVPERID